MNVPVEDAYEAYAESLFRYLVRLTGEEALAEDVFQDTFRVLLERPPRHQSNLRSWLFQVATNRFRDLRRRQGRQARALRRFDPSTMQADPPLSPDRAAQARDARARVRQMLGRLDERDRVILLMREEGFTHREIAEAVGTTTGSVGTMIARALGRAAKVAEPLETAP